MKAAEGLVKHLQEGWKKSEVLIFAENPDGSLRLVTVTDKNHCIEEARKIGGYDCKGNFPGMMILYNDDFEIMVEDLRVRNWNYAIFARGENGEIKFHCTCLSKAECAPILEKLEKEGKPSITFARCDIPH